MLARWQWLAIVVSRQFWFRAALFSLAGIVAAVSGIVLAPFVPDSMTTKIGASVIDDILNLLANSMLAVAVFSLSTIVSAYGAATNSVTPRATKLLMDDTTSKNVVGTFVGAFLYSLVGIIALGTGLYGSQGRAILLVFTILLILLVAVTLLRWVDYLAGFGRVVETIGLVETTTREALDRWLEHPNLGAAPLEAVPDDAERLHGPIGYVQHIDMGALEACAKEHDATIYVLAAPGKFVDALKPLAAVQGADAQALEETVRAAFAIGPNRTFEQDPRFGLCVLAEIASRALSPAVNDPGTAIDVIGRGVRLLSGWGEGRAERRDEAPRCPRVRLATLRLEDLFDDVFAPIARDGATHVEVQVRLQKGLGALAATRCEGFAEAAARSSAHALAHAEAAMRLEEEKARVRDLAAAVCGRARASGGLPRDG
ncbi:DUF2254 domain-containing protein [Elioraea rosea]|uniref:DUF2254 domain-containing protein n=1 Tax=Elioraea rosea TaxID=2492390 RepID=UPI0011840611|nr:DUF2254 domain-containing protein [Elioraea rosea]